MKRLTVLALSFVLLVAWSSVVEAQLMGPVFPPPGDVTFSSSAGSAADAGGVDFMFSDFDPSAFATLYWGPRDMESVAAGLDGALHTLAFVGISGMTATWEGASSYTPPAGGSPVMATVRLELTVTGLGADPWVEATTVPGLDPGVGAVVDNSAGADMTANIAFTADIGAGFVALNDVPQLPSPPELTVSSFFGGFFFTSRCTLDLKLETTPGVLSLGFLLGATEDTTWNAWLNLQNSVIQLWTVPLPPIDPAVDFTIDVPGFPELGKIGFLTTLVAPDGVICADFELVDTGSGASPLSKEELLDLLLGSSSREN